MNQPEPLVVHPIVRQIIDRDCHVGESNRRVIRHVISKRATAGGRIEECRVLTVGCSCSSA